jgi:hypothetical protein
MASSTSESSRRTNVMERADSFGKMEENMRVVGFMENRVEWATTATIMDLREKACGWMARDKNGSSDFQIIYTQLLILQK